MSAPTCVVSTSKTPVLAMQWSVKIPASPGQVRLLEELREVVSGLALHVGAGLLEHPRGRVDALLNRLDALKALRYKGGVRLVRGIAACRG